MSISLITGLIRSSVNVLPYGARRVIKHIPGIAAAQRWVIARVASREPFVHAINAGPAAGLRFEVVLPLDKAVWAGTYEAEFAAAIAAAVASKDVCYDVGGYRGYMSGVMSLAGALTVYVFEPLPENQAALRRLRHLNPKLPIEILPVAIGNFDGSGRLLTMNDSSMAKLTSSPFQVEARSLGGLSVSVRRLDTLVHSHQIPCPNVLKIDVEGAELEVLQGAAQVLRSARPIVFLEAHSEALERACSEELFRLGYKVQRLGSEPKNIEHTRHLLAKSAYE